MVRTAALIVLIFALCTPAAFATEEYAARSGRLCAECHADPAGGGALTRVGASFAAGGYRWPVREGSSPAVTPAGLRVVRFALGFLHLLSAFMWLGTIFYVHIVLRPSYAVGGLPKAELRIAWAAMVILALTGVPLTYLRFHHPAALLETRSGILLLAKIAIFLFLVLSAAYVSLVLSKKLKSVRSGWQHNDGREGRRGWVKVGEQLHDLTASARWPEGNHFGRHQAGTDLTEALKTAPHGPEKLAAFPAFSLADRSLGAENKAVRTLFVMAYVNLFAALAVVFVIALWRWG